MTRMHKWRMMGWLAALALLSAAWIAPAALAEGGFAISGNFYRQVLEMPQGATFSSPDVSVVVFNNGERPAEVTMQAQAPDGVMLNVGETEFTLEAGGEREIPVGVTVSEDAVPGEYEIMVIAEAHHADDKGIQVAGASAQKAKLIITGDAGRLQVRCLSPSGDPVPAVVKLYRLEGTERRERAHSNTGVMDVRLTPGDYVVAALVGDEKLAEEPFSIGVNETKQVDLQARTVYVEGVGVVPTYASQGGKISHARVVYTINNLSRAFPKTDIKLAVNYEGEMVEEMVLSSYDPLEKGRMGSNYTYIPANGWRVGSYTFEVAVYIEGTLYTSAEPVELIVKKGEAAGGGLAVWLILVLAIVVLAAIAVATVLVLRRRQPKAERE